MGSCVLATIARWRERCRGYPNNQATSVVCVGTLPLAIGCMELLQCATPVGSSSGVLSRLNPSSHVWWGDKNSATLIKQQGINAGHIQFLATTR